MRPNLALTTIVFALFLSLGACEVGLVGEWRFDNVTNEYSNDSSMVGWWHLNEGTGGTTADSSGNGNTGTLTNGPTWNDSGRFGNALTFDGLNDYVNVPSTTSLDIKENFSIAAWFKVTGTGTQRLAVKSGWYVTYYGWRLEINNGYPSLIVWSNSTSSYGQAPTAYNDGRWHFVVGTYARNERIIRLYMDGALVNWTTTAASSPFNASNNPLYLGADGPNGNVFNGSMDEVALYNRIVTPDEIRGWAAIGRDSSGRGNDASFFGNVTWNSTGRFDYGMTFDGLNDYASAGFNVRPTDAVSVEAWLTPRSFNSFGSAVCTGRSGGVLIFYPDGAGNVLFGEFDGAWRTVSISQASITGNVSHHFVLTYNRSNLTIYMDGVARASTSASGAITYDGAPVIIGGYTTLSPPFTPSSYFNGSIDEVRIYNRSLWPWEVAARAACNYTRTGNWTIAAPAFCRARIAMNGNLTIGSNFTLDNAFLTMNTTGGMNNLINVTTNGQFYANNTSIGVTDRFYKSYLTNHYSTPYTTKFRVYNTNFSDFGNTGAGAAWDSRGLSLASLNDSVFDGCRFENSPWMGMFLSGGGGQGFVLRNNVYKNITEHAVYFYSGIRAPVMENNTFTNVWAGLGLDSAGLSADETYLFENITFAANSIDLRFTDEQSTYCSRAYLRNSNPSSVAFSSFDGCKVRNWAYSKQHGGNITLTKIWGNLSYDRGFPQGRAAGLWHFDEGLGTASYDESVNGNNATLTNSPTWTAGRYGKGVDLYTTTNYITVPSSASLRLPHEFTLEAWIYPRNSSYYHGIIAKDNIVWGAVNYELLMEPGNYLSFRGMTPWGAYVTCYTGAQAISTGSWQHVAAVWKPTYNGNYTCELYINGTKQAIYSRFYDYNGTGYQWYDVSADALPGPLTTSSDALTIGTYGPESGTHYPFNGTIDEVRISSRALLPSEFLPLEHDASILGQTDANVTFMADTTPTFQNVTLNLTCTASSKCIIRLQTDNLTLNRTTIQASDISKPYSFGGPYVQKKVTIDNSNLTGYDWVFYFLGNSINGTSITNSYMRGAVYGAVLNGVTTVQYVLRNITMAPVSASLALEFGNSRMNGSNQVVDGIYCPYAPLYSSFGTSVDAIITNSNFSSLAVYSTNANFTCVNCAFAYSNPIGALTASSYLYSKQHNNNATDTRIWGNFTYTKAWQTRNTVGYWRFDEGTGTMTYDYTGMNNGSINNATWAAGRYGRALQFDGVDDYVAVSNSPSLSPTKITMEMWIKFNSVPFTNQIIMNKEGQYRLFDGASDPTHISVRYMTASTGWGVGWMRGNTTITPGVWHHIAATYDGSNWKVYLDGKLDGQQAESGALVSGSANVVIGYAGFGSYYLNGTIDEVRISNRALLPSEFLPFEHNMTISVMSGSSSVGGDAIITFDNMTENGTITANGTLYRYKDYPIQVVNGSGSAVASASVNFTDNYTGEAYNCTTNAAGWCYPHLFVSLTNNSVMTTVLHNLTAAKAGQWNSVLANSTRGNHTIVLGATQGYSIIGNATASGFTPNVTVGGSPFLGPYSGIQPVEIRNGSQIIAKFQHDFSAGDLDLNTITVRLGQYWVGFSGKLPATLYVPLRGTYCNVRVCTGITNQSETCVAGWSEWSSEAQGWFCLATINGTVAEEQADPAVTKLVAAPIRPEAAALLFGIATIFLFISRVFHSQRKHVKKR